MQVLVLASGSARRRDYLVQLGVRFEVIPADVDECITAGEAPATAALRLARDKAAAVQRRKPGCWVLAADTIVSVDHEIPVRAEPAVQLDEFGGKSAPTARILQDCSAAEILGKPAYRGEARRMLRLLSGREHSVITGVVLLMPGGAAEVDEAVVTRVRFRPLTADEIDAYLASGEADDKAGAYGIQGAAAPFIAGIDGSFSNVVGLPLEVVEPALRRHGFLPEPEKARR